MSTKVTLKYFVDEESGAIAHLYEECLAPDDFAVFLQLTGVPEVSVEASAAGNCVTVAIPRKLAIAMGLAPSPNP